MAAITLEARLDADGSFSVRKETLAAMGLHAGDEIKVIIETTRGLEPSDQPDQQELHRRARLANYEADRAIREPGGPLTDPLEAAWGSGVEEKARRMGLRI